MCLKQQHWALVHPGEVKCVISFAGSVQVSSVRFQQPKSTSCVGVAHEMDFTSPVLAFSCSQINAQNSVFTPETMNRFNLWQSRSSLTWPIGPGIQY